MKRSHLMFISMVSLVFVLTGIYPSATFAQQTSAQPLKFGAIANLTGFLADLGDRVIKGIELRLGEADWKVAGRPIKLIKEDDATNATVALDKARKLIEYDKVDFLFGPVHGASNIALARYCKKLNMFYLTPGTQDIGLGSLRSVIPFWGASQGQFTAIGKYVGERKKWKTVALASTDYSGPRKYLLDFERGFKEKGGQVVQTQFMPPMTMDFGPYITKIAKADGCMVWCPTGVDYANFRKQYSEFGLLKTMPLGAIMASSITEQELHDMGEVGMGMFGQNVWVLSWDTSINKKFVENFRTKYGRDPGGFDACGYEMASVALAAINMTKGDTNPQKLYQTVLRLKMEVVGGPLSFTPEGFAVRNAYMTEVKKVDGKYRWVVDYIYPANTYTKEEYEKGQVLK